MGERGPHGKNSGKPPCVITGIPRPPAGLNVCAKAEWKRVAKNLADAGLLTTLDRSMLEAYCIQYAIHQKAAKAVSDAKSLIYKTQSGFVAAIPQVGIMNKALEQMRHLCRELGMTPGSRGRISVPEKPDSDDFDKREAARAKKIAAANLKRTRKE